MFLTPGQLRTLTGFAHKARQVQQLRAMGVPFYVNRRGVPVVACSVVDGHTSTAPSAKAAPAWSPAVLSS